MTVDIGKYQETYAAVFAEAAKQIDEALEDAKQHPEYMKKGTALEQVALSVMALGAVSEAVTDGEEGPLYSAVSQALCAVASIAVIALVGKEGADKKRIDSLTPSHNQSCCTYAEHCTGWCNRDKEGDQCR